MVQSIKKRSKVINKSKKSNRSHKSKQNKKHRNIQKGGVSNSCVLPYADSSSSARQSVGFGAANLHNLNPQASLDLDNKFMRYGGPVPLGQFGGSSKCGDEGVGTSNYKTDTFKDYLNNLNEELSLKGGSSCSSGNGSGRNDRKLLQKGKGYSVNPEDYVAGNPVINGYDDNNPPAIIKGKLVMSGANRQVCGNGATRNAKTSKNSKKSRKHKTKNKNNQFQKGGDFVSIGSKPETFSSAFDGPAGVFKYPDDMKTRDFGEHQPNYSVNAI